MTTNLDNAANYANLCTAARDAIRARDAIENCFSPEWSAAHDIARDAGLARIREMERLAKTDRRGAWAGPAERELMLKGWL